ncbi:high-potential iron-sulfur protein [Paraburkholderia phymatum]|uniref:High-potential iron-sulfur protein n=1 Tax=Paraburkholderia phymatum (strain DSM 17167 / CIP 108236 / LMG 21445 / STM815) TaxID=391038 RepID=B2JHQ5_PARP8|nr:high-potential iron-sulfur protein [Paraburkholderia phymatum]ACC70397.1 High potential iron-sulfur protein [Paraburkholderia phymatum STM815]
MTTTRREFIVAGLGSAVGLCAILAATLDARADDKLSETDPAAQAVGYMSVAAKVDKAHFPAYTAGQTCSNCSLFQGNPTDAWGGCTLFGTKQVPGGGWCSSYTNM